MSPIEKLPQKWQNQITVTASGCWKMPKTSRNNRGYSLGWNFLPASKGGQKVATKHRIAYLAVTGKKIPPGRELHHVCRERLCCNPAHLKIVTKGQHREIHAGEKN